MDPDYDPNDPDNAPLTPEEQRAQDEQDRRFEKRRAERDQQNTS